MSPIRVDIWAKRFRYIPSFFLIPFVLLVPFLCSAQVLSIPDEVGRLFIFRQDSSDSDGNAYGHRQISIALTPSSGTVAPGATIQFSATVTRTWNTAVTWTASSGSISSTGLFTAPKQLGSVVVTATSAAPTNPQVSATISVSDPALAVTTGTLPNAQVGSAYSATIAVQGGTEPYAWSIGAGSLPQGLTLNSTTGTISGVASQAGSFTFIGKVTDVYGQSSTRQFSLGAASTTTTGSSGGTTNSGSGSYDGPAELPRVYMQSTMSDTPAPGNTITVSAGSDLQTVLKSANCGDTIQLQAGATFAGDFVLPAKGCDENHWIILRTSAPDSALPPEGTRITPCYAGVASLPGRPDFNCVSAQRSMARLMAVKAGGPLRLAAGANHYRIGPGLEITRPVDTGINYGLIQPTDNMSADHIVFDRDWVHGTPQDDTTRGLFLSGVTYAAIVDSYFNDFHCAVGVGTCFDSQTIAGGTGGLKQGVWKIVNNFLESSTEGTLFGGAPGISTPTDIEIRHNHYFKPLTWLHGQPGFVGKPDTVPSSCPKWDPNGGGQCPFSVKNHFELKTGQRVLFEGNILENVWANYTQHGFPIVLTPLGPSSATVTDITVRYNSSTGSAAGINIAARLINTTPILARLSIHDNLLDNINSSTYGNRELYGPIGSALELAGCGTSCTQVRDISIDHLTIVMHQPRLFAVLGAGVNLPLANVTITNNIVSTVPHLAITQNVRGDACTGSTNLSYLNSCVSTYIFRNNALISGTDNEWPSGNYFPAEVSAIGFANSRTGTVGDYTLLSTSPYKYAGTDGKDVGADLAAVEQATSGAY